MRQTAGAIKKVIAGLVPALLLTTSPLSTVALQTDRPIAASSSLGPFSRSLAMDHVRKLAGDIGVRVRASQGEIAGARYIARTFRDLGYRVSVQEFSVDDARSRNVIAWWPGARRYPIVLGAHMDTVPGSPGANDNASGVAVLLEMARLVRGTSHSGFLRFVAFSSEEYGSDGRHHV